MHQKNINALRDQQKQAALRNNNNVNFFWKEWLGGLAGQKEEVQTRNGWADDDDLSDYDEDQWTLGGMRRPGDQELNEGYTTEEQQWDDDDDDDHGGQMMPIPGL